MKTTFSAAAALLIATTVAGSTTDLPMKAAPLLSPAPVWSWSGFYVGAHVGAGWGTTETTLTSVTASAPLAVSPLVVPLNVSFAQNSRSGFLGGGQAGYNWQNGWVVFGVQGDIAGTDIKGTTPCVVVLSRTTKSDWLATVTGRIGGVIADRGLLYVKGGGAWLNSNSNVNLPMIGLGGGALASGAQLTSTSRTSSGWLLGMGLEYMFTRNWTGFIEYDYMDFSAQNVRATFPLIPGLAINADQKDKLSIAKVGLNYKFDGFIAPIAAKY